MNLSVVLEDGKEQEVQLFEVFSDQVAAITQVLLIFYIKICEFNPFFCNVYI